MSSWAPRIFEDDDGWNAVVRVVCFTLHIFDQTRCQGCGDQRPVESAVSRSIMDSACCRCLSSCWKLNLIDGPLENFIKYISRLYSIKSHKALESRYLYAFPICKLCCGVDLLWYQNICILFWRLAWCDPRWSFCFSPPINICGCPRVTPVCRLRLYTQPPHNTLPTPG